MYDYSEFGSKAVREEIEQIKEKEKEYKRVILKTQPICRRLKKAIRILINKASN